MGVVVQCVVASLLCLSGGYGNLLDMISLVVVIFYTLTIAGIFILRKKRPDVERPYKAFGYPLLPLIYILMGTTFCILLIVYKPDFTWPGLIITLLGIPLYYFAIRQNKATRKVGLDEVWDLTITLVKSRFLVYKDLITSFDPIQKCEISGQ